jgi:hypothetical protein
MGETRRLIAERSAYLEHATAQQDNPSIGSRCQYSIIQNLLSNSSIKTIEIYTQVAQLSRSASPLDSLGM